MATEPHNRIELFEAKLAGGRPTILDGATGTELQRRGVATELPLWSAAALLTHRDLVKEIHVEYLKAGADIITTNTFRTGTRPVSKAGIAHSAAELTRIACEVAHEARHEYGRENTLVAGCIATLEDCYEPELTPSDEELRAEHEELARYLKQGEVDFLFAETMNSIRETLAVLNAARGVGLPVAVSFVCDADGNLLSGESISDAIEAVKSHSPLFVGTNCAPPARMMASIRALLSETSVPVCAFANGMGRPGGALGWEFGEVGAEAATYADFAKSWVEQGVKVLGGCCGTTPEYISELRKLSDSVR